MLALGGISRRPGTEDDQIPGDVVGLAAHGVRSSVVRLAPMVHSDLDHHGFTTALIGFARENGSAAYIDQGANRWPAAYTRDIAVLYRLALEKAPAGSTLHGVADEGIPFKQIATTIAAKLAVSTRSVTAEQAPDALGFLGTFAGLDNPTSNDKTRALLGWEPTHAGWVEDVQAGHYFA
jgi:nucleoside-diphosphate-sugar epimerase